MRYARGWMSSSVTDGGTVVSPFFIFIFIRKNILDGKD